MNGGERSSGYMPQLDALRALAVFAVLFSHFGLIDSVLWLREGVDWGRLGVRLFFVLSGFLITGILLDERNRLGRGLVSPIGALGKFYRNRALRIFPLFYLVVFLLFILDFQGFADQAWRHALYLSNLDSTRYVEHSGNLVLAHAPSAHFWSLAVEEQFYLVWPAMILFLPQRLILPAIIAMILAGPTWRAYWLFLGTPEYPHWGMLLLPGSLDSLGIGALLALYRRDVTLQNRWRRLLPALVLAAGIACIVLLALRVVGAGGRLQLTVLDSGLALVFAALINHVADNRMDFIGRILLWRPLSYIGRISYGIYIYHAFAPHLLDWLAASQGLPSLRGSALWSLSLYLTSIAMAMASWHLFERIFLRLKYREPPLAPSQPMAKMA